MAFLADIAEEQQLSQTVAEQLVGCGNRLFIVKSELVNMTRAWDKEGGVPDRNQALDLKHMSFKFARSCHVDQFTFNISLPSLKFTIFIHLSQTIFYFNLLVKTNIKINWSC